MREDEEVEVARFTRIFCIQELGPGTVMGSCFRDFMRFNLFICDRIYSFSFSSEVVADLASGFMASERIFPGFIGEIEGSDLCSLRVAIEAAPLKPVF